MPISASKIVNVIPRVLAGSGEDLVFNGLILTDAATLLTDLPTPFATAAEVGAYFGERSPEAALAQVYFAGFNNSRIKPTALYFYQRVTEKRGAYVRGGRLADRAETLAALQRETAATFALFIGSRNVNLTAVDFSRINSLTEAADLLQDKINAAAAGDALFANLRAAYRPEMNCFTLVTGVDDGPAADLAVSDISGTAAEAMGLTVATGAGLSTGADPLPYTDTMNRLTAGFQNFVTFATVGQVTADEALELARWASAQAAGGNQYLYVCWDGDTRNEQGGVTDLIAEKLRAAEVGATCVVYPRPEIAAFVMGAAASVAWDQANGSITFAFKAQAGLGADVTDRQASDALDAHGVNYIGNFATRNDNFVFLYNGQMSGEWQWIDAYLNAVWLNNALQTQILAGLTTAVRVPYTDSGYAAIRAWCADVVTRALNNHVIEAGVVLSETQKNAIIAEAGSDVTGDLYNNGYVLRIATATAAQRQHRVSPACNFWYTYGGAVHKLSIPSTAVV